MRGASQTYQQGNLTISTLQDNQPVVTIITTSDPTTTPSVPRKIKMVQRHHIHAHILLHKCNQYMNDKLHGYYHVRLKRRKFYKFIFLVLV